MKKIALGHFEASLAPPHNPLSMEVEIEHSTSVVPPPRQYLRIYYGDFLGVAPMHKPNFADPEEKMLDCDEWFNWIRLAHPRTRVDAYPMLLVCKELLDRFVRRDLTLISRRTVELEKLLERANATIQAQELQLEAVRLRMSKVSGASKSRQFRD